jgi:hypothetical protein
MDGHQARQQLTRLEDLELADGRTASMQRKAPAYKVTT